MKKQKEKPEYTKDALTTAIIFFGDPIDPRRELFK